MLFHICHSCACDSCLYDLQVSGGVWKSRDCRTNDNNWDKPFDTNWCNFSHIWNMWRRSGVGKMQSKFLRRTVRRENMHNLLWWATELLLCALRSLCYLPSLCSKVVYKKQQLVARNLNFSGKWRHNKLYWKLVDAGLSTRKARRALCVEGSFTE